MLEIRLLGCQPLANATTTPTTKLRLPSVTTKPQATLSTTANLREFRSILKTMIAIISVILLLEIVVILYDFVRKKNKKKKKSKEEPPISQMAELRDVTSQQVVNTLADETLKSWMKMSRRKKSETQILFPKLFQTSHRQEKKRKNNEYSDDNSYFQYFDTEINFNPSTSV